MGNRHNAIDVLQRAEPVGLFRRFRDEPRDRARTVDRSQHPQIVPRSRAAIGAAIALKGPLGLRRQGAQVGAELMLQRVQ